MTDAEDARRLFLAAVALPSVSQSQLLCVSPPMATGTLCTVSSTKGMDRNQQQKRWQRYQLAARNTLAITDQDLTRSTVDVDHQPALSQMGAFLEHQPTHESSSQQIYAVLGQCLYRSRIEDASGSILKSTSVETLRKRPSTHRAFAHVVPGLVRSLRSSELVPGPTTEFLRILAIPSPWMPSGQLPNERPPLLEILVHIDPASKELQAHDVNVLSQQRHTDVMLPDKAADLRFVRRSIGQLTSPDATATISEFLRASQLKIAGRSQLRTPSTLTLKIPRRMIAPHKILASIDTTNADDVEVEYLFAGLEHRQLLEFRHAGLRMQYVSVEAGRTGGHWCELRLLKEASQGDVLDLDPSQPSVPLERLYRAAVSFVDDLPSKFITSSS